MATRVAGSVLSAIGLDELICPDYAAYEELAVELANDSDKLYSYRRHIENSRDNCALFDTERWVRNVEKGFTLAWKKYELQTSSAAVNMFGLNAGVQIDTHTHPSATHDTHTHSKGAVGHDGTHTTPPIEDDYSYLLENDDIVVTDSEPVFVENSSIF